ncbi:MAG: tyrosine-type recombinase/integrase [Streptosporangiaceae bacterium]
MTARRRRPPGEGSVFEYKTRDGVTRFGIKFDTPSGDGKRHQVMRRRDANGQPWLDREAAVAALREAVVKADKGDWIEPSMQPLAEWLETWVNGLRVQPSTRARYRNDITSHVIPYIGAVPLAKLTSAKLDALYRELEESGHRDSKGQRTGKPLSLRSVRSVAITLSAALNAATNSEPPLLTRNPAVKSKPPTDKEAQAAAPEMRPWTAEQLRHFLAWARDHHRRFFAIWYVLAYTGMRRGELLALRWRDIDLDAATISVRRSVGVVRVTGQRGYLREGPTKTSKPRVVDIDLETVAVLRAWKRDRGALALQLARNDAVVFGTHEGEFRQPERLSHLFRETQQRCARMLGDDALPVIRMHDLRHTHATILLRDRENVKVVSERLGHANVTVTLTTYSHVMPGDQRQAAARFAALVADAGA